MGRGKLVFKGDKPKKKKRKGKFERGDEVLESLQDAKIEEAARQQTHNEKSQQASPTSKTPSAAIEIPEPRDATGLITSSATVVTGHESKFTRELSVGDAIVVHIANESEMRVVTMLLSDTSLNLSSPFSHNISEPIGFRYIRKPSSATCRDKTQQDGTSVQPATGVYHDIDSVDRLTEFVYRERTEHGSYRIKREPVGGLGYSREKMLEMRAKKTSDKYC